MDNDYEKIEQLFKEGKQDEAKQALLEMLSGDLTQAEKGKIYVDYMMTYLKVMNDINDKYIQSMNETLAELNQIDRSEEDEKKTSGTEQARQDIAEM